MEFYKRILLSALLLFSINCYSLANPENNYLEQDDEYLQDILEDTLEEENLEQQEILKNIESPLNYRLELINSTSYINNLTQVINGSGDIYNKLGVIGNLRYKFLPDTHLLLNTQGLMLRYLNNYNYNQSILLGSLSLSQWFINSINSYIGVMPIFLKGDNEANIKRFDNDLFLGITYFNIINNNSIAFIGYQLDKLNAEVPVYSYLAHNFLGGYKYYFSPKLNIISLLRTSFRNYDKREYESKLYSEQRYTLEINLLYSMFKWLELGLKTDVTYVNSLDPNRTLFLYGLNFEIIGGI